MRRLATAVENRTAAVATKAKLSAVGPTRTRVSRSRRGRVFTTAPTAVRVHSCADISARLQPAQRGWNHCVSVLADSVDDSRYKQLCYCNHDRCMLAAGDWRGCSQNYTKRSYRRIRRQSSVGLLRRVMFLAHFCAVCLSVWQAARFQMVAGGKSVPVTREILQLLDDNDRYDKQATPNQHDAGYSPTNLTIAMYIEGISSFRAQTMDFHLDMYFQQRWNDQRLRHNESRRILIRDVDILRRIWHPDVYFANARIAEFHDVTQPNFLLWLESDGTIFYDTRISLSVMCMMHLAKWPLDSQTCRLRILSYAYDTDQLRISWAAKAAISKNEHIKMPDMHLLGVVPGTCNGNFPTGVWSCVTAEFNVKREIMHHITQSYIPTALIVVISWFSFWLDVDAVPARVSLSITTLLTLSTQANAARMALPEVSYMKAIDVWMGMCMAFVFGVMIEFTVANYAQRQGEKQALRKDRSEAIEKEKGDTGGAISVGSGGSGSPSVLQKLNRNLSLSTPRRRRHGTDQFLFKSEGGGGSTNDERQREQRALEVLRRAIRSRKERTNNRCQPQIRFETTPEYLTPSGQRKSPSALFYHQLSQSEKSALETTEKKKSLASLIYHQLPEETSISPPFPNADNNNLPPPQYPENTLSPGTNRKVSALRNLIQTNALDGSGGVGLSNTAITSGVGQQQQDPTSVAISRGVLRSSLGQKSVCFSSSAERLASWGVSGGAGGAQGDVSPPLPAPPGGYQPGNNNTINAAAQAPTHSGGWSRLKSALGSDSESGSRRVSSFRRPTIGGEVGGGSLTKRISMGPDKWMTIIKQAHTNRKLFGRRAAKRIDHHARWSFPAMFLFLNAIYWYYYLYVAKNVD